MNNRKILVVEDDADVRLGYQVLLKANHYDTVFAADGLFAISEAHKHQPDLMILDLGLPAGDGFSVLDTFRQIASFAAVPVIVVSARDVHGNRDRALKAGAKAYLQKPWNDQALLDIISQELGEPGPSVAEPAPAPPQPASSVDKKKILVVEDDADVRLGYQVLLQANHYDTVFACDASSALGEARKHQPDLVLLDLGLPAGDGFLVLERFRALTPVAAIPVIVVSGRSLHSNRERALKAGARAFVQKPWNDHELLAIIGRLTGRPELLLSQSA